MKTFERRNNESGEQFANRIDRYLIDKIIEDIESIVNLPYLQIKSILNQLNPEALEIIEEDCSKLEKFEVCKIARELIENKKKL